MCESKDSQTAVAANGKGGQSLAEPLKRFVACGVCKANVFVFETRFSNFSLPKSSSSEEKRTGGAGCEFAAV